MTQTRVPAFLWFLAGAIAAGGIGSAATLSSVTSWYPTLHKPGWTPPNWLFGPVWSCLYVAMAFAAWRVWRRMAPRPNDARWVVRLYSVQLLLNAAWSVIFFGLRQPGFALADILALWVVLVSMLVTFARADRLAGALWLAYVAWVSFATALNAAVWRLNVPGS